MNRLSDPREAMALRRSWRRGWFPVPAPCPANEEASERLVHAAEPWDTGLLAAIYPDAGAKAQAYLDGAR